MVCLDSSFIIDVIRGNKNIENMEGKIDMASEAITVAAPVIMELIKGAILSEKPETEKQKVFAFLSSFIILNLNRDSAILAGEIDAKLRKLGHHIGIEDIMIGAICLTNNERLLTKNLKHFEKIPCLEIETY